MSDSEKFVFVIEGQHGEVADCTVQENGFNDEIRVKRVKKNKRNKSVTALLLGIKSPTELICFKFRFKKAKVRDELHVGVELIPEPASCLVTPMFTF